MTFKQINDPPSPTQNIHQTLKIIIFYVNRVFVPSVGGKTALEMEFEMSEFLTGI